MAILPQSYTAAGSITVDGTAVTVNDVTVCTGAENGTLIKTLEVSNSGAYDAVARIKRADADDAVYMDICLNLQPGQTIVLWDDLVVLPEGHTLILAADAADVGVTVSCHEGFPAPPAITNGYVRVFISGTEDGQWSLDAGTTWNNSGDTVTVPEGSCTVTFKPVFEKATPDPRVVAINGGELMSIEEFYVTETGYYLYHTGDAVAKVIALEGPNAASSTTGGVFTTGSAIYRYAPNSGILLIADFGYFNETSIFAVSHSGRIGAPLTYSDQWLVIGSEHGGAMRFGSLYHSYMSNNTTLGLFMDSAFDGPTPRTAVQVVGGGSSATNRKFGLLLLANGYVYVFSAMNASPSFTQESSISTWTALCSNTTDTDCWRLYMIRSDGGLYRLNGSDAGGFDNPPVQIGSITGWEDAVNTLGILSTGKLMSINITTSTTPQIGVATNWSSIGGAGLLALNASGELYRVITGPDVEQVGSASNWTVISRNQPYAINSAGEMYHVDTATGTTTRKGLTSDWIRFTGDFAIRGTAI